MRWKNNKLPIENKFISHKIIYLFFLLPFLYQLAHISTQFTNEMKDMVVALISAQQTDTFFNGMGNVFNVYVFLIPT